MAWAGRWPRGWGSARGTRLPLCDFTGFATSQDRLRPTHSAAGLHSALWLLRVSLPPGLGLSQLSRRNLPAARYLSVSWPPPPGSPQQASFAAGPAQRPLTAMLCFLRGMAFVPFLLVTWSSAAFIISYVVAVLSGHVNPFLPYIR